MGLTDLFADLYAAISFTEVHAEAAPEKEEAEGEEGEESKEGGEQEGGDSGEGESEEKEEGGEEEKEEEPEEEEEEEEEPEDPMPKLHEECARSAQCSGMKHHYDECVERVTHQHSDPNHKGPKEDCVEEFFHLQHCAAQCAAPKLFRMLK